MNKIDVINELIKEYRNTAQLGYILECELNKRNNEITDAIAKSNKNISNDGEKLFHCNIINRIVSNNYCKDFCNFCEEK